MGPLRHGAILTVAPAKIVQDTRVEYLDEQIAKRAPLAPSQVDNQGLFIDLPVELGNKRIQSLGCEVGQMNVADAAASLSGNIRSVCFNPGEVAETNVT